MIDIIKALNQNLKEASKLLQGKGEVSLTEWDDDADGGNGMYDCEDCGTYIRYADDDGNITSNLVVAVRYNNLKRIIEIMTAENEYTKADGNWFPLSWADDISYYQVLDTIGELYG